MPYLNGSPWAFFIGFQFRPPISLPPPPQKNDSFLQNSLSIYWSISGCLIDFYFNMWLIQMITHGRFSSDISFDPFPHPTPPPKKKNTTKTTGVDSSFGHIFECSASCLCSNHGSETYLVGLILTWWFIIYPKNLDHIMPNRHPSVIFSDRAKIFFCDLISLPQP